MSYIHNPNIKKHNLISIVVWTILIALSLSWNIYSNTEKTSELALLEARALFNKDKSFRFWAASHGGVYVPQSKKTPSNPFLAHIPDRDITTDTGKKLTLMNPAYMLRQMMETYEDVYGVRGHITSTIHFRPETAPDEWEKRALKRFEKGEKEVVEFSKIQGQPYLRLMQPLYAKKSCIKCHGHQGYKEGQLRGGVSLSVPMKAHITAQKSSVIGLFVSHLLILLLGLIIIVLEGKKLGKKTDELIAHRVHLENTVAERTTELVKTNNVLEGVNQRLETLNEALSDRESRLIELKHEVNELCTASGNDTRYKETEKALNNPKDL